MTVQSTPFAIQSGGEPAESFRRLTAAHFGGRGGIVGPNDLAVTQRGAGANMSVDVADGQVIILGTESTYQGCYLGENRGALNVVIAAAHASNPRRDLIVARIRDSAYSGGSNAFTIEAVTGTAAASPSDPALPAGTCWVLARVSVAALASSIVNANIADLRSSYTSAQYGRAAALGGVVVCTSTTRPPAPYEGMPIYQTDTHTALRWNGSAWKDENELGGGGWTSFAPTVTQSGTVAKTVAYARYQRIGRTIVGSMLLNITGAGTTANPIYVSYPVTPSYTGNTACGSGYWYDASQSPLFNTGVIVALSASGLALLDTTQPSGSFMSSPALAAGDALTFDFVYEAAS